MYRQFSTLNLSHIYKFLFTNFLPLIVLSAFLLWLSIWALTSHLYACGVTFMRGIHYILHHCITHPAPSVRVQLQWVWTVQGKGEWIRNVRQTKQRYKRSKQRHRIVKRATQWIKNSLYIPYSKREEGRQKTSPDTKNKHRNHLFNT